MSILITPTLTSLLEATCKCIYAHQQIFDRGVLVCDISPGNLAWNGMMWDFDQSVIHDELPKDGSGGPRHRGTRPFKAIGVLRGEQNSYMNDLESFFWVLFWICMYREESSINHIIIPRFDRWWYMNNEALLGAKQELVQNEAEFLRACKDNFTPFHQPLVPAVNSLRKVVFPGGVVRDSADDKNLYQDMMADLKASIKRL